VSASSTRRPGTFLVVRSSLSVIWGPSRAQREFPSRSGERCSVAVVNPTGINVMTAMRAMVLAQVQAAGGFETVAGLRIAYMSDLIGPEEFARRMECLPSPPEIVHPSQLPS
jgi:hypothetical protein